MGILSKLFGKKQTERSKQNTGNKKFPTLEEFPKLDAGNRMGLIMALGDSARHEFFPFLKYAIAVDEDVNVKFAALKRIHLFKDHPETIPFLKELHKNGGGNKAEPYFSMALSRLGIITVQEMEDKINNFRD